MSESVVIVRKGEDFVIVEIPRPGTAVDILEFGIVIECQPILSAGPKGKGRSVEKGTGKPEDKPTKPAGSWTGKKRGRPKKARPEDLPEEEPGEEPFEGDLYNEDTEIPEEKEDTIPMFPPGTPIQPDVIVPPAAPDQEHGTGTP